jgi:hypothetical protein
MRIAPKYRKFANSLGFETSQRVAFYRAPEMQRADVGKDGRMPKPAKAFRPEGLPPETLHDDDPAYGSGNIRCPACQWQPDKFSRWFCISMGPPENFTGGCGNGWNTFDTRGICPGCQHHWRHTTCLSCSVTSLHDDWYVSGGNPQKPKP